MRTPLLPLLLAAALAGSAGLACAQTNLGLNGSATIDGTGAGINAGAGSTISGTPGNRTPGAGDITTPPSTGTLGANPNDTRVLGAGARTPGNIVPDNLPGTMDPRNATIGVNGTGTLDGSVPGDRDVNGGVGTDVQR